MNYELMFDSLPDLLAATVLTLNIFFVTLVFGSALALPLALLRVQRNPLMWMPVHAYIYFFRGTPLILQVFLVYYCFSQFEAVRESWAWVFLRSAYWCAIITISLNMAAYVANLLRGAIQAVPAGEIEAGRACGMSTVVLYRSIILPQAFRLMLPAYGNEVIGLLKCTSLACTITLIELTGAARDIVARTFSPYEVFIAAAAIYLFLAFLITRVVMLAEYRFSQHTRPPRVSPATKKTGVSV
jgi:polar amino acid transport system permease protein/octopine/nopaline transport system permease protein